MPAVNYTPIIVVDTTNMDESTWHSYRRKGIGGSDVAAVYGQSPFCTTRDLYYTKIGIKPVIEEEENWVAKKYGHLLEDLVAEIFSRKTGLRVYKKSYLYAHPDYPFMQANVDFFVQMPDGSEAILECKTCNYNCRDKWDNDAVPFNYELQVRHYMAIMNIGKAFVACLYGNNENEFVYRTIDRDLDFEADMIEQEKYFWYDYVQAGVEPPYTEAGELVLNSIRKYKGTADKSASTVVLDPTLAVSIQKYLDLREIKLNHDREAKKLDEELKTVMVPVYDKMGASCLATCRKDGVEYSITFNPIYRKGISASDLERLETLHKNIYDDFVTKSESRRVSVKQRTL